MSTATPPWCRKDAAHTALAAARARAAEQARVEVARSAPSRTARRAVARTVPPEHLATTKLLRDKRAELGDLTDADNARRELLRAARDDLGQLPRWARARRQGLISTIGAGEDAMRGTHPKHARLSAEIDQLARRERQQARELAVSTDPADRQELAERLRARLTRPGAALARPRPVDLALPVADAAQQRPHEWAPEHQMTRQRDEGPGLSR